MKKIIIASSVVTFSFFNLSNIFVGEVKGEVKGEVEGEIKTDVNVRATIQSNIGAGNKNIANLGSVYGKLTVEGDFEEQAKEKAKAN